MKVISFSLGFQHQSSCGNFPWTKDRSAERNASSYLLETLHAETGKAAWHVRGEGREAGPTILWANGWKKDLDFASQAFCT